MTVQEQLDALNTTVPQWAVKRDPRVKGEFTSGEYIEWQLRQIFGSNGWQLAITSSPEIVTISESDGYARCGVTLTVMFADGERIFHAAVGVWPLRASNAKNGGTLEQTASERYETALKACITDGLKAAAERLGSCFRPLGDENLIAHLASESYRSSSLGKAEETKTATEHLEDLGFKSPKPKPAKSNGNSTANTKADFFKLATAAVAAGVEPGTVTRIVKVHQPSDNWPTACAELQRQIDIANDKKDDIPF